MNPLTDDMCPDLWGELEFAAMRRQTLAGFCRCIYPSSLRLPLVQRDLVELDVLLGYLLGRGTTALERGQRLFIKPGDMRWRQ